MSTITLDNCSTNEKIIDKIKDKLHLGNLLRDETLLHMCCCAHIFNLIVKDGLKFVKDGIEKIRDSVAFWIATPKRKENFKETVKQLRIPCTKTLVLDCPTRWISTYKMLQIAISYEVVFTQLKQRESQYTCFLHSGNFAKDVCGRLKVFNVVTKIFFATKQPTTNMYFSKICKINLAIKHWVTSPNELIHKMTKKIMIKLDKYWDVIHDIMGVAIVLDPRYKMELLQYYYQSLYECDCFAQVSKIRQLCYDLVSDYQFKMNDDSFHNSPIPEGGNVKGDELCEFDKYISREKRP